MHGASLARDALLSYHPLQVVLPRCLPGASDRYRVLATEVPGTSVAPEPRQYLDQPLDIRLIRRHPERRAYRSDRVTPSALAHAQREVAEAPAGATRLGEAGRGAVGDEVERLLRCAGVAEAAAAHRDAGETSALLHQLVRDGFTARVEDVERESSAAVVAVAWAVHAHERRAVVEAERAQASGEVRGERGHVATDARHPDLVEEVEAADHRAEIEEAHRAVFEPVGTVAHQVRAVLHRDV